MTGFVSVSANKREDGEKIIQVNESKENFTRNEAKRVHVVNRSAVSGTITETRTILCRSTIVTTVC